MNCSPQDNTVTSELSLSNVDWEDAGYYYCEGSYSQGTVSSTPAKVFVRGNVSCLNYFLFTLISRFTWI